MYIFHLLLIDVNVLLLCVTCVSSDVRVLHNLAAHTSSHTRAQTHTHIIDRFIIMSTS